MENGWLIWKVKQQFPSFIYMIIRGSVRNSWMRIAVEFQHFVLPWPLVLEHFFFLKISTCEGSWQKNLSTSEWIRISKYQRRDDLSFVNESFNKECNHFASQLQTFLNLWDVKKNSWLFFISTSKEHSAVFNTM